MVTDHLGDILVRRLKLPSWLTTKLHLVSWRWFHLRQKSAGFEPAGAEASPLGGHVRPTFVRRYSSDWWKSGEG